jgi:hypothetical protein
VRFRPGARSVRIGLGIVVTAISAAGCAPAPDQGSHTVDEYRKNRALLEERLARCAEDPGLLGKSVDCINAREAERSVGIGSLRALKPLKLPDQP